MSDSNVQFWFVKVQFSSLYWRYSVYEQTQISVFSLLHLPACNVTSTCSKRNSVTHYRMRSLPLCLSPLTSLWYSPRSHAVPIQPLGQEQCPLMWSHVPPFWHKHLWLQPNPNKPAGHSGRVLKKKKKPHLNHFSLFNTLTHYSVRFIPHYLSSSVRSTLPYTHTPRCRRGISQCSDKRRSENSLDRKNQPDTLERVEREKKRNPVVLTSARASVVCL